MVIDNGVIWNARSEPERFAGVFLTLCAGMRVVFDKLAQIGRSLPNRGPLQEIKQLLT